MRQFDLSMCLVDNVQHPGLLWLRPLLRPCDFGAGWPVLQRGRDGHDTQENGEMANEDEKGGADDAGDDEEVGDYTLTLRFVGVPRSEVEHTAEDCIHSGDYPADSYEIDGEPYDEE